MILPIEIEKLIPWSKVPKAYLVYMLRCGDGSYYVGVTNNLEKRVAEHKAGLDQNAYTYQRRPVELMYMEEHASIDDAIRREKQLQGWSRKKKEALMKGDWEQLKKLAKSKNNH